MKTSVVFELEDNKVQQLTAIPLEATELYLEFEFQIVGSYQPATWDYPAEFPDLEGGDILVAEVTFIDGSVVSLNEKQIKALDKLLTKEQIDMMDAACWEHFDNLNDYN
jgi:hypothetical protein